MPVDLERARRETPGVATVVHFNNAGAALMPRPVLDAVTGHLRQEAQIGGYEAADQARDAVDRVYTAAAALIGCSPDEIAIIENATRAWDMAFYALPLKAGDRILVARAEYASNYIAALQVAKRTGAQIEVIPSDDHGQIDIDALRRMADERVRLIAITHVPSNGGLVNPAAEVGAVAREIGATYLLDACQSIGQMPVDVETIGCDFLAATGRKYLRGPRGTGFLYVRRSMLNAVEPPFLDLHAATWADPDHYIMRADARRFENWESNVAGKIGLGVAIDYALSWGLSDIRTRIKALAEDLRARLAALPGVDLHDLGVERCGIVTFTIRGQEPDAIRLALAEQHINVSVARQASTLLDMQARSLTDVVRASVHYYNSESEIAQFCTALEKLIRHRITA